jgi:hypothetical protein
MILADIGTDFMAHTAADVQSTEVNTIKSAVARLEGRRSAAHCSHNQESQNPF